MWFDSHFGLSLDKWLSLLSAFLYVSCFITKKQKGLTSCSSLLWSAWMVHSSVIVVYLLSSAGHYFGVTPTLTVVLWLVVAIYAFESMLFRNFQIGKLLPLTCAIVLLLGVITPSIHLRGMPTSDWLMLHWVLAVACYGLFVVAIAHAYLSGLAERRLRLGMRDEYQLPLLQLERLTYRFVDIGFIFLTVILVLSISFVEVRSGIHGSSGNGIWGWRWVWDQKILFSLLAWIVFAVLIVGRRIFGWRGKRAKRFLYLGAALLALTYLGGLLMMLSPFT